MKSASPEQRHWERHWLALSSERSLFGALASAVRKVLLSRAVLHYTDRHFASRGLFVEAGCGTSESSGRIARRERRLIGLDFSLAALRQARRTRTFEGLVCADVRRLPFRDGALAGIWNLGVMEHFDPHQGRQILDGFRRALRPKDGILLLFWPPTYGLSRWVLAPFEWLLGRYQGREFRFFPDEVNRLPSRAAARQCLAAAQLAPVRIDFTPRDGFNHLIVVARKIEP